MKPLARLDASAIPLPAGQPFAHVFCVLVHENGECVFDLVRNLRFFDPDSRILLYDGSGGGALLLDPDALAQFGAVTHPSPKRMEWGRLHVYMFDCLEYALDHYAFDAMTVVDSDQMLVRTGYADAVRSALAARPRAGLLAKPHPNNGLPPDQNPVTPERVRWEPMRDCVGHRGTQQLPIWIFWPGTVLTAAVSEAVLPLREDATFVEILKRSEIASEEVAFSTLAVLLGYEVVERPWDDRFLRWRPALRSWEVAEALDDPSCYWLHPVTRDRDDPARAYLRRASNEYHAFTRRPAVPGAEPAARSRRRFFGRTSRSRDA